MSNKYTIITSFTDIIEHVIPGTLIILDLDETVFKFDNVGHPNWWKNTYEKYLTMYKTHEKADSASLVEWTEKVNKLSAEHTDEVGLYRFLQDIEESGNPVIALTARHVTMSKMTANHIDDIGIKFNNLNITESLIEYNNGIFYLGHGIDKGDAIIYILDILNDNYDNTLKRVVFVDNSLKHIQTAAESLDASKYIGYLYMADFLT